MASEWPPAGPRPPRRPPLTHDRRVQLLFLALGAPALALALALLWRTGASGETRWTAVIVLGALWLGGAAVLRAQVMRPLHTLANMLAALRAGDYSMRARRADPDDALGLVLWELNALAGLLHEQRLGALEAGALLRHVIASVDVAVYAFDQEARLRLVNPEGQRLLGAPAERLLGRTAAELGLDVLLEDEPAAESARRVANLALPGNTGRFEVRRGSFRQGGRPHALLLVADVGLALRAEERQAWQRLVRVMSHEINNSLAPIKSIAGSLLRRLTNARAAAAAASGAPAATAEAGSPIAQATPALGTRAPTAEESFAHGLSVVAERAESLSRFIGAYARLTRLPPPRMADVDIAVLAARAAALEPRVPVRVADGPRVTLRGDPDQLEQLLINLVRNAADASLETGGGVTVRWEAHFPSGTWRIVVEDEGPGIADASNLFVPFYSTKPEGSGIGLALSRQIAEAHGGELTLANREDGRGARAVLALPR